MGRKIFKTFFVFVFCFASLFSSAFATAISGKVIESVASAGKSFDMTSNVLVGAIVTIEGTNFSTITNSNGMFTFTDNIPPGTYNIGAYKEGYYLETKRVTVTEVPVNLVFILTKKKNARISEPDPSLQQTNSSGYIPDALYVAFSAITAPGSPASAGSSKLKLSYRILETATMEIVSAGSVEKKFSKDDAFSSCYNVEELLTNRAIAEASEKLLTDIFPNYQPPKQEAKKSTQKASKPAKQVDYSLPLD